jgi:MFS family permease
MSNEATIVASDISDQSGTQSPPATKRLLPSLAVTSLVLFATYAGLGAILLPIQVAHIDGPNKVANLAIVSTVSFIFTILAQPLIGALSDRTRSRLGRRAPWMVIGAAIGGLLLCGLGGLDSILWITLFWVIIQVALNTLQAPMTAIVPDRFERNRRGAASAMMGLGMTIGGTAGIILASVVASQIGVGYTTFGIAVIIVTFLFVLINRDWSNVSVARTRFSLWAFLKAFWVSPVKHRDFAWAFAARFLFILGYFVIFGYQLYILTDYIGLSLPAATAQMPLLSIASMVTTLISITISGWWSDRVGRRKVFIYVASVIMAIGLAIPLVNPTVGGLITMSAVLGFGFGI